MRPQSFALGQRQCISRNEFSSNSVCGSRGGRQRLASKCSIVLNAIAISFILASAKFAFAAITQRSNLIAATCSRLLGSTGVRGTQRTLVTAGAPRNTSDVVQFSSLPKKTKEHPMKLVIAGFLLAISGGFAMAQTSTSPGTSTAPGSSGSATTGMAPGTPSATPAERPRIQGNVPSTSPGGAVAPQTSGPDPATPRPPTSPDKQDPSPR